MSLNAKDTRINPPETPDSSPAESAPAPRSCITCRYYTPNHGDNCIRVPSCPTVDYAYWENAPAPREEDAALRETLGRFARRHFPSWPYGLSALIQDIYSYVRTKLTAERERAERMQRLFETAAKVGDDHRQARATAEADVARKEAMLKIAERCIEECDEARVEAKQWHEAYDRALDDEATLRAEARALREALESIERNSGDANMSQIARAALREAKQEPPHA